MTLIKMIRRLRNSRGMTDRIKENLGHIFNVNANCEAETLSGRAKNAMDEERFVAVVYQLLDNLIGE